MTMVAKLRTPLKQRRRTFLREWRKYRNLTQQQLADRIDASTGLISQIENGQTAYTQGTLEALADALQCEPADVLMRDPTDTGAIWTIWDQAAPDQKRQIEEVARIIVRGGKTGTGDT